MALTGDASDLKLRSSRRDVGIEAGGGGGDQIDWNIGTRMVGLCGCCVGGDAIDQLLVCRRVVRAAGVCSVIAGAGRRWARMKVAWGGEGLPDDA